MSWLYWLAGGLTVFLLVYLLYSLFNAEEVA
ncbi:K(+)-transporting ATPase subunit F [Chitinimonas sp.]